MTIMSETESCVIAIIVTLISILLGLIIFRLGNFGGNYSTRDRFLDGVKAFREAQSIAERLYVVWASQVFLFRGVLGLFMGFLLSLASVAIIGGACGRDSTIGRIVWDLYERYVRLWLDQYILPSPAPGNS